MPKLELEPFRRVLDGDQEPTEHQRKFLYLPLPILRDYTNIRSIIIKHTRRKNNTPLRGIEIIAYHRKMSKLDEWENLHLDELEYKWDGSDVQM